MADILDALHRQPRQFRRIDRQLTDFDDVELRRRYRFSSDNIDRLTRLLNHRLQRRTRRNRPLTPRQQVMIALRFYASGNFLQVIGDTFGVDVATVSRVVANVTDGLFDMKDRAIRFPKTNTELRAAKQAFYSLRGFPCVVGCIDGTHVKVIAPGHPDEPAYLNRKRQHSINVQATCDGKGRITSINACWPGSCHDAHIFRSSSLCQHLEENHQDFEKGVLLGDSGYPCRPFLLTPYSNPEGATSSQQTNDASIQSMKLDIDNLKTELKEERDRRMSLEINFNSLQNLVLSVQNDTTEKIDLLEGNVERIVNKTKVAFYAQVLPSMDDIEPWATIVFANVISNFGEAYNGTSGLFVTPAAGVYAFYSNILSAGRVYIETVLQVNGKNKMYLYSGSEKFRGSGSNMAIVHLNVGDVVNMAKHGPWGIRPFTVHKVWSSFSGFMLLADDPAY